MPRTYGKSIQRKGDEIAGIEVTSNFEPFEQRNDIFRVLFGIRLFVQIKRMLFCLTPYGSNTEAW